MPKTSGRHALGRCHGTHVLNSANVEGQTNMRALLDPLTPWLVSIAELAALVAGGLVLHAVVYAVARRVALDLTGVPRIELHPDGDGRDRELPRPLGVGIQGPALQHPALAPAELAGVGGKVLGLEDDQPGYLGQADAGTARKPAVGSDGQAHGQFLARNNAAGSSQCGVQLQVAFTGQLLEGRGSALAAGLLLPLVEAARTLEQSAPHTLAAAGDRSQQLTRVLRDALHGVLHRLQFGQVLLATVGSTAPFVGLLGTVWGIYHALTAIGMDGSFRIEQVSGPVGEALVMTAAGLAVAIPAVLAYNVLGRQIVRIEADLEGFARDLRELLVHPAGPGPTKD